MGELLIERAAPALEAVGDGWTVYGMAVPYGVQNRVTDDGGLTFYTEVFEPGSFSRDVTKGGRWVNLMVGHSGDDGDRFLGRCLSLEDRTDGLYGSFRLDRSNPQAEAARAGELRGWSVSARVYRSTKETDAMGQPLIRRQACGLSHVAATASPQYAGAGVLVARDHVITEARRTPRLDALRDWRKSL
jgi:HK97 family phage prohead protease